MQYRLPGNYEHACRGVSVSIYGWLLKRLKEHHIICIYSGFWGQAAWKKYETIYFSVKSSLLFQRLLFAVPLGVSAVSRLPPFVPCMLFSHANEHQVCFPHIHKSPLWSPFPGFLPATSNSVLNISTGPDSIWISTAQLFLMVSLLLRHSHGVLTTFLVSSQWYDMATFCSFTRQSLKLELILDID